MSHLVPMELARVRSPDVPVVFAVDVSQTESLDIARALRIMATPSTVEIDDGKIQGIYIGSIPEDVMARFA